MDLKQGPPAGWYPHPSMAGTLCYWDGSGWTEHAAPMAPARIPVSMSSGPPDVLVGIGWTATLFLPVAGFVIGIVVAAKGATGHGLGMIVGSVLVACLWAARGGYI